MGIRKCGPTAAGVLKVGNTEALGVGHTGAPGVGHTEAPGVGHTEAPGVGHTEALGAVGRHADRHQSEGRRGGGHGVE